MKLYRYLLIVGMAILLVTACACNSGTSDATTPNASPDTNAPTEVPTEAPAVKVDVTLTVQDQDGKPMAESVVTILPVNEEGESATLTANNQGVITVTLPEGEYTVRFDILPEYVLGIDTTITVRTGMDPIVLEVTDNTPNGTVERPFVVNEDSVDVSIPAGVTYHFTLFGSNNRTLTLTDAGAEVIYKDTTYSPDENGLISVRMSTDSPRDHAYFAVTNKGSDEREFHITILSDPGAMDNPIVVETLGENITVSVPKDGMVYYKWTATASGTLTVNSADTINNISLNNLMTSQVTDFTQGSETASITITEGDEITIVVSTVGGDLNAEAQTVTFMLTLS